MKGSAATFSPTHFIVTMVRAPATDAPAAASSATFSFGDHSQYKPSPEYLTSVSRISVDGVPGYPKAAPTPPS